MALRQCRRQHGDVDAGPHQPRRTQAPGLGDRSLSDRLLTARRAVGRSGRVTGRPVGPGGGGSRTTRASRSRVLPIPSHACRRAVRRLVSPRGRDEEGRIRPRPGTDHVQRGVGGVALSMPDVPHPDVGALLPGYAIGTGCTIVAAWAEAPAGAGPGPVAAYLADLTGVDPETTRLSSRRSSPSSPGSRRHRDLSGGVPRPRRRVDRSRTGRVGGNARVTASP